MADLDCVQEEKLRPQQNTTVQPVAMCVCPWQEELWKTTGPDVKGRQLVKTQAPAPTPPPKLLYSMYFKI